MHDANEAYYDLLLSLKNDTALYLLSGNIHSVKNMTYLACQCHLKTLIAENNSPDSLSKVNKEGYMGRPQETVEI